MCSPWRAALVTVAMALAVACASARAEAQQAQRLPGVGPLARLGRGLKDVLISPFELPATIRRVAVEKDPFTGLWAGGLEGIGNGLSRLTAGLVEIASSPIPSTTMPLYTKKLGETASPGRGLPAGITRP
jgi:putative exosortase-associated protein (TIGR04073 family)